ncbi:hypothetical protein B0T22DRAFT_16075 [Podospora appendiculata]|uniref:Uncharacterized protein n=1 Tax=Podospora appendiculata TaxID=314037 RepID=A0AAE0XFQ0_9PEZI|nr:hypothetical protein B0T22DRAFT_16075 [Podospora appendiculata]
MPDGKNAGGAVAAEELTVTDRAATAASSLAYRSRVQRARLSGPVRFALVVILSLTISSLASSFLNVVTQGELTRISRQPESMTEKGLLAAWRIFELALAWFGDYDGYDLAALALMSHGPTTLLMTVFYGIRARTAGAYLGIDVVSAFLPFILLRQLSGAHSAAPGVPNREIVADRGIQVLTALLSALVYSTTLFLACRTFLPTTLVLAFEGIPTIVPAADAMLFGFGSPATQNLCLLFGAAARTFIFTPFITTPPATQDKEASEFDPVSATLGQTVAYNLWGFTGQTKVSIKRTAVAMLLTAVNTYLQCSSMINGVESYGAAAYASIWTVATMITGLLLRYVGGL